MLETFKELFLNLDATLGTVVGNLGNLAYVLLFSIVFLETGVVIFAFLPGDTLLLAVGVVAANPDVEFHVITINFILIIAAICGNMLNYFIGKKFGRGIIQSGRLPFVKSHNIQRAERFYNKYGAWALVISRFLPYVRSFVPFFAGVGGMKWSRYMQFNIIGAVAWITTLTLTGYFFGQLDIVRDNIFYVIIFLAVFPFLPIIYARIRMTRGK